MPFIRTSLNTILTANQEEILKKRFGEAISCIRGKTEEMLMLEFKDSCRMWFRGKQYPMAMVEVSIFGKASDEDCEHMTAVITQILSEELGLAASQVYVNYSEFSHWGANGHSV